ncbi:polyprenyl diphosphate synthase [Candidatus Macondimonas diazotrophica]|jgi:undecaprenyl diphosphate synthase|uniref:Ditrans,polycis-undecaprenyl-diphosphate synthase ((2E,6E)-farnesyl-diphosphate specific) n=1 Tax=Candidatus Macondimonas diazotrophica TaxID=2305248 RepID=A0A4Z0FAP9_9GAMM|nr:polyprenyl diphosphate synthase [Candidatus Macondimonas diazotrophica]HBG30336.1 di-trans,poly-cis-decaprenylcistransferase [Gammaproteobacteria bacterium]NCU00918.1 di-trans,poly-cis-decaprenylcistransferase [Candidatus Macondimonas diazotrophica]TFZ83254.1 di-trans,poly-cis-decaprenylcistransferase [Candidatus Macondimonas diazotrophica]HBG52085.1 di-trans,poly-cis-decaprenylcistransferase [Gammaproteobacteria bacterium]HCO44258.1 di-trans,poly-cis-decaprenylcistransferase [Gammaproteoba
MNSAASSRVPRHIAIIMDGNGRWAMQQGKPRLHGHEAGVHAARTIVRAGRDAGVEALTLYAFSSENWLRPATEVSFLLELFIRTMAVELDTLHDEGVRVRFIGDRTALPSNLLAIIEASERRTASNPGMVLVIALGYGGRQDLVQTVRALGAQIEAGALKAADLDEKTLRDALDLGDLPDPDLLIRTGGEYRISNFLLWHLAYTEFYFSDILWPDFSSADFHQALAWFAERERRFGRTGAQVHSERGDQDAQ